MAFLRALAIAAPLAFGAVQPLDALAEPVAAARPADAFERDRKAILAMAGDYKVRFDFRETAAIDPAYTPLPPKTSGGHEVVRVIEDTGRHIKLQHLLVVDAGGAPMVIKHWRQDWTYEPQTVLTYAGNGRWTVTPVPEAERTGAWSQTVWQTDDSPRYGGVGRWNHAFGEARWTSGPTWRPLARRDAIRNPPYDRYDAINRHALTPAGWIHLQDNVKIGPKDGALQTVVYEDGLNTYERFSAFDVAAADDYWSKTKGYWAEVRRAWEAAAADGVVAVEEEADAGAVTGPELMGLAEQIVGGEVSEADAIARARALIAAEDARVAARASR
jgi:hypothetical protein